METVATGVVQLPTNAILFDDEEAAKILKLHVGTLRNWRSNRHNQRGIRGPKFVKIGGNVRYRLSDIEAFISEAEVKKPRRGRGRPRKVKNLDTK